ncbi:prepilin-type N-terminal cleavage/methylation domain-containing protein [Candidatus Gracilibacteria bacterium]|nr:prepilin-type N-terminal cleavage/methylation domain-containing protein [Candidatus Gracilibacteria bacterium]
MNIDKNLKAFTFVELIIVIVIVSILSTIGLLTYNSYISKSRDSSRVSQVSSINSAMDSYRTKGYIPKPEDKVSIYSSGELIGYQGYATEDILNQIGYMEGGKDPKDNKYFTYYTNAKQRKFGILAMLENNVSKTEEINLERIPVAYGDSVGILFDKDNVLIQDSQKYKTSGIDIDTTPDVFNAYFSDKDSISGTGFMLQVLYGTAITGIIGETCQDYVDANAGYLLKPGNYLIKDNSSLTKVFCPMDNNCKGTIPLNAEANYSTSSGARRSYSTIPGECTYKCDISHIWDGDSCEDL